MRMSLGVRETQPHYSPFNLYNHLSLHLLSQYHLNLHLLSQHHLNLHLLSLHHLNLHLLSLHLLNLYHLNLHHLSLHHYHNYQHHHNIHLYEIQHGILVGAGILMYGDHQMQENQTINGVQLDVTIGHSLISVRMVEHSKHAMIVELPRDVAVLISMQLMPLLKYYNNLNNRKVYHKIQSCQMT